MAEHEKDEKDHPPCCGPDCAGSTCWDCRGTGHPHPLTAEKDEADALDALRASLAAAIYDDGDKAEWLTTVDGSPNAASYELADRVLGLLRPEAKAERVRQNRISLWADVLLDPDRDERFTPIRPVVEALVAEARKPVFPPAGGAS